MRGPVATMTLSQSSGGSATSPRSSVIERMRFERRRHRGGKAVAVDRQRAARRHLVGIGRAHDQRAEPAHFLVQQADRVVRGIVGAERVRADQLRIAAGLVRGGAALGPHLVQRHRHAALARAARRPPSRRGRRRSHGRAWVSWRKLGAPPAPSVRGNRAHFSGSANENARRGRAFRNRCAGDQPWWVAFQATRWMSERLMPISASSRSPSADSSRSLIIAVPLAEEADNGGKHGSTSFFRSGFGPANRSAGK